MIDKATVERILADNIPCEITCHNCQRLVEVNMVNYDAIYKAMVEAEQEEIKKSLAFARTFKPVDPCPHIGSKQVIMANGEDVGEVWCNLENQPCMEDWDKCPKKNKEKVA